MKYCISQVLHHILQGLVDALIFFLDHQDMESTSLTPPLDPDLQIHQLEFEEPPSNRHKTALRLRYESEARVILQQIGGLEGARSRLGLSQRKICQLLLVDPSAWTRWSKVGAKIPPHVVRSLQWYLTLESKDPAWAGWREWILKREPDPHLDRWRRDLESQIKTRIELPPKSIEFDPNLKSQIDRLEAENLRLAQNLEKQAGVGFGWKLLLLMNSLALGALVFKSLF